MFANYLKNFIQHFSVKAFAIRRGNIGVHFKATGQLLTVYPAYFKYLRKNGNTMKQCISSL
jgi:hypothetical protein